MGYGISNLLNDIVGSFYHGRAPLPVDTAEHVTAADPSGMGLGALPETPPEVNPPGSVVTSPGGVAPSASVPASAQATEGPQYKDWRHWAQTMPKEEFDKIIAEHSHLGGYDEKGNRLIYDEGGPSEADYQRMSPATFKRVTEGKPGFGFVQMGKKFEKVISPQSKGFGIGDINLEGMTPHHVTALAGLIGALNRTDYEHQLLQANQMANLLKLQELKSWHAEKAHETHEKLIHQRGTYGGDKNNPDLGYFRTFLSDPTGVSVPEKYKPLFHEAKRKYQEGLTAKISEAEKGGKPLTAADRLALEQKYRKLHESSLMAQ